MRRPNLLIALAWLLNFSAWFLPVAMPLGPGDKTGPTFKGFEAFVYALSAVMPGNLGAWGYSAPLPILSVLTSLLFIIGSPWVLFRGSRSLKRFSAWVAIVAFLLNAHWNWWGFGLVIGYFLWWSSFAVLAAGLFAISGRKDAAEPTRTHAALLPR